MGKILIQTWKKKMLYTQNSITIRSEVDGYWLKNYLINKLLLLVIDKILVKLITDRNSQMQNFHFHYQPSQRIGGGEDLDYIPWFI